jgi:CheY-like chemotaxis protein
LEVTDEALHGLHFLVVDDAIDNQFLTKYILESKGARVDVANSGVEALDMLEKLSYDLVLLDIQMPVMDGYQTLTILRQRGYQMPVVAITAHAMKEDIINTMSAGFAHHLTKPLNIEELIRVVSKLA